MRDKIYTLFKIFFHTSGLKYGNLLTLVQNVILTTKHVVDTMLYHDLCHLCRLDKKLYLFTTSLF